MEGMFFLALEFEVNAYHKFRHSGTPPVASGEQVVFTENTLVSSSPPVTPEEDRSRLLSPPCPHSLITESSMFPSVTPSHSLSLQSSLRSAEVSNLFCQSGVISNWRHFRCLGSPWGSGTFSAADGSRQPTELELKLATIQGKVFYETVSKVKF